MEVILLKSHRHLGKIGDVCSVANGFARNYLIPKKMAIYATSSNKKDFDLIKHRFELQEVEFKTHAAGITVKIDGVMLMFIMSAGENGKLFGSIAAKDITLALMERHGLDVDKSHVMLTAHIKSIGITKVQVAPHKDIHAHIFVNVARSESEAQSAWESYAVANGIVASSDTTNVNNPIDDVSLNTDAASIN